MGMEQVYRDVMQINTTDDMEGRRQAAKSFFERLNSMDKPEYFNWASEIFEGLHVKERGAKTALIWADMDSDRERKFSYKEFAANGNKLLNFLRKNGVDKGHNLYMMIPIVPETRAQAGRYSPQPECSRMGQVGLEFFFCSLECGGNSHRFSFQGLEWSQVHGTPEYV
ncbi:MAG: hypothetical protein U5L00_18670 [Desulfovermiculus sp.]|nr:hypothetical protein [Desulfovermiculus sp.]